VREPCGASATGMGDSFSHRFARGSRGRTAPGRKEEGGGAPPGLSGEIPPSVGLMATTDSWTCEAHRRTETTRGLCFLEGATKTRAHAHPGQVWPRVAPPPHSPSVRLRCSPPSPACSAPGRPGPRGTQARGKGGIKGGGARFLTFHSPFPKKNAPHPDSHDLDLLFLHSGIAATCLSGPFLSTGGCTCEFAPGSGIHRTRPTSSATPPPPAQRVEGGGMPPPPPWGRRRWCCRAPPSRALPAPAP